MGDEIKRGDRDAGCRCRQFVIDCLDEDDPPDEDGITGWYGPKCPHHSEVVLNG